MTSWLWWLDDNKIIIGVIFIIILFYTWFYSGFFDSKALVIVEPRKHEHLQYVCENFDKNMCKSWDLYVFHGKSASAFAQAATAGIKGRRVYLIPLNTDSLDGDGYNALFKSLEFWEQVKAENILVFQTDAVLCSASEFKVKDFMKYDYIGCGSYAGAIGNKKDIWGKEYSKGNSFYGIGGLSFRKNSFQKQCIRKYPGIAADYPEDVFFSNCVEESSNKPESAEVLANFCTQDSFLKRSFGAHNTWYMKKEDREPFYAFCPAARILETKK
uniref:DUF5672 domain-containing protein n=1 Tax=viral metagenome TaxID=1070528 RepID=A0A6C0AN10_9ZZZZ